MEPFATLSGSAVPREEANLDTNQLCPTRFNKVPKGPRFAQILLHDRRFYADGSEKPEYILNQEPYRHAVIAAAGRNFGVGSSRETAVFGLIGFGIRCVIAPSFGDIFFGNALRNGLLPVRLPGATVAALMRQLIAQRGAQLGIDLPSQTVTGPDGRSIASRSRTPGNTPPPSGGSRTMRRNHSRGSIPDPAVSAVIFSCPQNAIRR